MNSRDVNHLAYANINPILREDVQLIIKCAIELYGKHINVEELLFKLDKCFIGIRSQEEDDFFRKYSNTSGYFNVSYSEEKGFEASIIIKDNKDISTLIHEICHLLSQQIKVSKLSDYSEKRNEYLSENINYLYQGVSITSLSDNTKSIGEGDLGDSINEALTMFFAQQIENLYNIKKRQREGSEYKHCIDVYQSSIDSEYQIIWNIIRNLKYSAGESIEEAYFRGNPFIIIDKFDMVLGQGAWKKLAMPLDQIARAILTQDVNVRVMALEKQAKDMVNQYLNKKAQTKMTAHYNENDKINNNNNIKIIKDKIKDRNINLDL